jgi:hypothetical protein
MRTRTRAGALAFAAASALGLLAAEQGAHAAACGDPREAATGPLPGGTEAADFGAIPEACAGTDVTLRLRGAALIASEAPDFFGDIVATSTLRLRHRVGRSGRTWLSLAADVLTYRYVVNGNVISDGFAFGPPTLGLHHALGDGERLAATIYGRALLPLDTARANSVRTGLELGATLRLPLGVSGRGGLEGGVGVLGPLVVVGGQTHGAIEPVALVQGWFSARPRFALFAGATAKGELAPDATLLTLAPRLGLRWVSRRGLTLAFLAEAPVAGTDRTDAIVAFFLGWAAPAPTP